VTVMDHSERIVVGIDGSPLAEAALRWALREAQLRGVGVDVVLAWTYPAVAVTKYGGSTLPVIVPADIEKAATNVLNATMGLAEEAAPGVDLTGAVERGHPAAVLSAKAKGAALVVVGSRGHGGFAGMLLGSASNHLLHHAPCPVVVVNSADASEDGRLVVGVDGSGPSIAALRWGLREAQLRGVGVDVVHAWDYPASLYETILPTTKAEFLQAATQVLRDTMGAVAAEATGVDARPIVSRGHPVDMLMQKAEGAALVIVGSRGHGGFTGMLLGSVSRGLVHHAPCPAVVLRGDGRPERPVLSSSGSSG
jgi:nucleotide-binding universal stress UspA family protein